MANLTIGQMQAVARAAGFPDNMLVTMGAIGMAESSGNPNAINDGSATHSNEYSVGLFQINRKAHPEYSVAQLQDPNINAQMAYKVYKSEGLRAWGVYTSGVYKKYLSQSQAIFDGGGSNVKITGGNPSTTNYAALGFVGLAAWLILNR